VILERRAFSPADVARNAGLESPALQAGKPALQRNCVSLLGLQNRVTIEIEPTL
jgi:hypothetical protein